MVRGSDSRSEIDMVPSFQPSRRTCWGLRAIVVRLGVAGSFLAAVCAWLLTMPVAASASTVALRPEHPETLGDGEPSGADVLYFDAGPGERNVVSAQVDSAPDGASWVRWTITDMGAVVVAVEPCRASDAHTVVCVP